MKHLLPWLLATFCAVGMAGSASATDAAPDAGQIVRLAHAAAGGDSWKRPRTLHLTGNATLYGDGTAASRSDVQHYEMWRVFPAWSQAAHGANGKFRLGGTCRWRRARPGSRPGTRATSRSAGRRTCWRRYRRRTGWRCRSSAGSAGASSCRRRRRRGPGARSGPHRVRRRWRWPIRPSRPRRMWPTATATGVSSRFSGFGCAGGWQEWPRVARDAVPAPSVAVLNRASERPRSRAAPGR